jgi:hypothetical protein
MLGRRDENARVLLLEGFEDRKLTPLIQHFVQWRIIMLEVLNLRVLLLISLIKGTEEFRFLNP